MVRNPTLKILNTGLLKVVNYVDSSNFMAFHSEIERSYKLALENYETISNSVDCAPGFLSEL